MQIIYSVGLYCPYEGGSPFIFFNKEKDAIFLKDFLERYSDALSDRSTDNEDDFKIYLSISELNDEFRAYFNLKSSFNFPWKFKESYSKFQINQHVVMSLDAKSESILNRISDFEH